MKNDRSARKASAERVEARENLRRSGASGPHRDRREARARTRGAARARDIRESVALLEWEHTTALRAF
jgi:hypothetical protein